MKEKAFDARVLIQRDETASVNQTSGLYGLDRGDVELVKVLDWGTNRDGTPFGSQIENSPYVAGVSAYIRKDAMGIKLEGGRAILDRGYILIILS